MYDVVGKRNWFFAFSALVIIPGIIALFLWGLRLGIDFTGGTLWELDFSNLPKSEEVRQVLVDKGVEVYSIQQVGEKNYLIRSKEINQAKNKEIRDVLGQKFSEVKEARFETVGPAISKELTENSFKAVGLAMLAIIIYITWAFRQVPKRYSSFRFGVSAIIALLHDVLVVVGVFAILGHFFGAEIDSLFVTAVLTVIGFSVHDTIVVFDRIRENLIKHSELTFPVAVNESILQTLARSLSTSLTVVFVLSALLLFGGETIRWFVAALLVGIISGTYSSIFNAAQVLVVWQNWIERRRNR
jgi:preprotein translocase subunit SecF